MSSWKRVLPAGQYLLMPPGLRASLSLILANLPALSFGCLPMPCALCAFSLITGGTQELRSGVRSGDGLGGDMPEALARGLCQHAGNQ